MEDAHIVDLFWARSENAISEASAKYGDYCHSIAYSTMPNYGVDIKGARFRYKVCPVKDQLLALINDSLNPFVQDVTLRQLDLIQISPDGNTLSSTTGRLADPIMG